MKHWFSIRLPASGRTGRARSADEFALPYAGHFSGVVKQVQDAQQALCLEQVRDRFPEIDPAALQGAEGERRRMKMSEEIGRLSEWPQLRLGVPRDNADGQREASRERTARS